MTKLPTLPKLIVTDLDGTLLRADKSVSERSRAAIFAARLCGIQVAIATARPPLTASRFAATVGIGGFAICANGAITLDLESSQIIHHTPLEAEVAIGIVRQMRQRIPDVTFGALYLDGFGAEPEYAALATYAEHGRLIEEMRLADAETLLDRDLVKLIVRHADVPPAAIMSALSQLTGVGFESSLSGAPFVEVVAAGVTKGAALERLVTRLGIEQLEVVAFGDNQNDASMLAWAGWGVALGNATPECLAIANEVAETNEVDGVAIVIERILAEFCADAVGSGQGKTSGSALR